jgi:fibronectin type 3 domain-containing protein
MTRLLTIAALMLIGYIAGCSTARGGTVKLAWNPNPEPNITHYTLYWWESEKFQNKQEQVVGVMLTTAIVTDLEPGNTYVFGVTAHNDLGMSSRMSETVSYEVPLPLPILVVTLTIQASDDLKEWNDIGTIVVPRKEKEFFRIKIVSP